MANNTKLININLEKLTIKYGQPFLGELESEKILSE